MNSLRETLPILFKDYRPNTVPRATAENPNAEGHCNTCEYKSECAMYLQALPNVGIHG